MKFVCRKDCAALSSALTTRLEYAQLLSAVDSISANITEGYGRMHGRDRARFYEMALGSSREARDRYRGCTSVIGEAAVDERNELLTRAIKLLSTAIPAERAGASEERMRRAREKRSGAATDSGKPRRKPRR